MVDPDRVRSMLRRRAGDISDLSAEDPDGLIDDPRGLRAVKYSCVTAVEAAIDVAQHLCASEQWGSPTTNADAFTILARRGVIDAELATRLAGAVGFRNVLVHEYAVVDDRRVVAALAELDDLRELIRAVEALLEANRS